MGSTFGCKLFSWLIFFFIFLFSVYAFEIDCSIVPDQETCLEIINNPELNEEEMQMIISALIYQSYYPDHNFIYQWNHNAELNYEGISDGYIENAYLKIKGISPSVLINNELYAINSGTILLDYDYDIDIPNNIIGNDCDTEYEIDEETFTLDVYRNNIFLGSSNEITFNINEDTEFSARLHVYLRTRIEHYEWDEGECEYDSSEYHEDEIILEDNLFAKLYTLEPELDFEVLSNNYGSLSFLINVDNGWFDIEFDNAYYKKFKDYYGLEINNSLLTMKAYDFNVTDSSNIIYSNGVYTVDDNQDCEIIYGDHFRTYETDCNLGFNNYNLSIETDKLSYDKDELIHVDIYPSDEDVLLSYGNESVIVNGNYEFESNPLINRVTAKLGNEETYKVIHVRDDSDYILLFNFGTFSGLSYLFYLIFRKYYGGWL